ncbi:hypothetical protein SDC9_153131 [bioreactor metagenome]|uniref:DUF4178 domain-containing protein n=1 Tax=bioreactor metagenome TaxID=1076179 RepID=A0A645EVJ7_9ZZZZ
MTQLLTAEQVTATPADKINTMINQAFIYDDFAWQKEQQLRITYPKRAEGLHKVLYQCPHCHTEYQMTSSGTQLNCVACHKSWQMNEYGELVALDGLTEFSHIPDWYEWERSNVRNEVQNGTYHFESKVTVESLPNAKGFIPLGEALLRHDMDGFRLSGNYGNEPYEMIKSVDSMYSCHIEYSYLGKHGDCIDLNTLDDTYYIYPYGQPFSVTKIALATEELYNHKKKKPS